MNAVSIDPNLLVQLFEGLLWAFVWAVGVLFGVELVCVVALWFLDWRQGHALRPAIKAPAPGHG